MGVDLLQIGKSGLMASKKSLSTTGHNIANANTEGYSRQRVNLQTNMPIGSGNVTMGTGVKVNSIKRISDEYIEKNVNQSANTHAYFKEKSGLLNQVEEIFNEINSDGLNKIMNRFFNSFRELANQPENETVRSVVRENARLVVKDFARISEHLGNVTSSMDRKLEGMVIDVNQILHTISDLNMEIRQLENSHGETGDLRDQRDVAVQELSKLLKVNTYVDEKGSYVVNAAGVGTLVSGKQLQEFAPGNIDHEEGATNHYGMREIYYKSKSSRPISSYIEKGTIAAVLETRNNEMKALQDQIDNVAYELANTVNAIHRRGYGNYRLPEDENGNIYNPEAHQVAGINFFATPEKVRGAAEALSLSDAVKSDLRNIVTAIEPNKPGDNRISLAISKLQHEKLFLEGSTTMEEYYLQSVGNIGLSTAKSNLDQEQAKGILAQARSIRERLSGVSIDEESANMVKFQQAYDASARVITASDSMFKSVLEMWRP
ncbi:MAG: flagellar hook-associated protein FlgK [Bacteriovoracaceae bacterium]|mgnify:CR=1 FL=1|nr:flagellar hook-associated protein FlgK [Bacteriovoracaceae bacterium]